MAEAAPDPEIDEDEEAAAPQGTRWLAVCWGLVFLAMAWAQGSLQASGANWLSGGILARTAHRFGAMTTLEVLDGQVWRLLTATFIHFSMIHLAFNLVMLVQLGRFVEPWYGPGTYLALYVIVGTLGNLIAALAKPYFGHPLDQLSGGGSGVLCGLIALLAVVGWRSRTRYGAYIQRQMVGLLVFIAITGRVIPNVGNLEHAGGAIAGALFGFVHRPLLRGIERRWLRGLLAAFAVAAITLAGLAQWRDDRQETRRLDQLQQQLRTRNDLIAQVIEVEGHLRWLATVPMTSTSLAERSGQREALARNLETLSRLDGQLPAGAEREALAAFLATARPAIGKRPTPGQVSAFLEATRVLVDQTRPAQERDLQQFQRLSHRARLTPNIVRGPGARPQ